MVLTDFFFILYKIIFMQCFSNSPVLVWSVGCLLLFIVFHINVAEASQITVRCRPVLMVNNNLFG